MNAKKPKVLDVGQCDLDHGNIKRMLSEGFGAGVDRASTSDEAVRTLRASDFDLVLVNRIFDRDGASGLEFIERLRTDHVMPDIPVMLVSNYADAQDSAVALGAKRGFGKNALTSRETIDLLATVLGTKHRSKS